MKTASRTRWGISVHPFRLFVLTSGGTLLVAFIYLLFFPGSYFDLSIVTYFTLSSYYLWFIFSAYLLTLALIYFIEEKRKLRVRPWLLLSHYIFVLLFLLVFFAFSQFNERYIRKLLSSYAATTVVVLYGTVFLIDLILFFTGLILLLANLFSAKKAGNPGQGI